MPKSFLFDAHLKSYFWILNTEFWILNSEYRIEIQKKTTLWKKKLRKRAVVSFWVFCLFLIMLNIKRLSKISAPGGDKKLCLTFFFEYFSLLIYFLVKHKRSRCESHSQYCFGKRYFCTRIKRRGCKNCTCCDWSSRTNAWWMF